MPALTQTHMFLNFTGKVKYVWIYMVTFVSKYSHTRSSVAAESRDNVQHTRDPTRYWLAPSECEQFWNTTRTQRDTAIQVC